MIKNFFGALFVAALLIAGLNSSIQKAEASQAELAYDGYYADWSSCTCPNRGADSVRLDPIYL